MALNINEITLNIDQLEKIYVQLKIRSNLPSDFGENSILNQKKLF